MFGCVSMYVPACTPELSLVVACCEYVPVFSRGLQEVDVCGPARSCIATGPPSGLAGQGSWPKR